MLLMSEQPEILRSATIFGSGDYCFMKKTKVGDFEGFVFSFERKKEERKRERESDKKVGFIEGL